MLLDMMTSTAAKHGDAEHSTPRPPTSPSFFSHMPLSILSSVLQKPAAASEEPPADISKPQTPLVNPHQQIPTTSPTTSRRASTSSLASNDEKRKKRAPRPKTTYRLAQPPSATRAKLHIRPKVLLQLHQVVASSRPKPVYEVIPFSLLTARSTRRLARTFYSKSRDRLCPSDLIVVKAEEYGQQDEDSKSDDERWGARDVVGIICPAKDDKDGSIKTEVLINDGACWEVTNLPNGGYEFGCTDEHGLSLKSRWVPKPVHSRRTSAMTITPQPSPILEDRKFNFSTISASTRRHPVIATMTRTNIDVLDSYTMPSATSPPTPGYPPSDYPTPLATPSSIINPSSFLDAAKDGLAVKTDDTLRRFIVLSGIWVAFSEGWSPYFSFAKATAPSPLATSTTFRPSAPTRNMSFAVDSPRSASPASILEENCRTIPRIFRTGTHMLRHASSGTISSPTQDSPSVSPRIKTRAGRSNSTGNADFNPRTGSMRKRFGLALENQSLPETEEERQIKRSVEISRIKELVLPNPPTKPVAASPNPSMAPVTFLDQAPNRRSPSPLSIDTRTAKTQSAYNPVTTTGLWDSGVVDGPRLKTRPTSLVILNGKKEKAKRKQERSKSKEKGRSVDMEQEGARKGGRLRQCLEGIFHKKKN